MRDHLQRHRQVVLYLVGGVISVVIDVGLMQLLLMQASGVVLATTAGFVSGLLFNYVFHSRMTFQSPMSGGSFARYMTVVAFNYLLTLASVGLSVWLLAHPMPGKLVSLFIVPVIGFLAGKYWIFSTAR
jgi:putative flippase GtrA